MVDGINDFLIRGHQKVIGHYKLLLVSPNLAASERQLIESRLAEEEIHLETLIESAFKIKSAQRL